MADINIKVIKAIQETGNPERYSYDANSTLPLK